MGEVIYGAFIRQREETIAIKSPKRRTLLNADWLWKFKGWAYQVPSTNLPARWEKEVAGVVVWAYECELNGRYGRYTFERRSDAHVSRWRAGV